MYICQKCLKTIGPRVAANKVVGLTRITEYNNIRVTVDEYDKETKEQVHSVGYEIVSESTVCSTCEDGSPIVAALPVKSQPSPFDEKLPEPAKFTFAMSIVNNALNKAELVKPSQRAKRDLAIVVPLIKQFVASNSEGNV